MDDISAKPPAPTARTLFRSALAALILLTCTVGFLWLSAWGYTRHSLVTCMVGSVLATCTLALTMRALDRPLVKCALPFYIRLPLKLNKRVLLLAQLITTAVAVGMGFVMAFHFKLPDM